MMTAVGKVPEKEVNTEAKLREKVKKMEQEYLKGAKMGEVRKGLWTITIAKTEGKGLEKATDVEEAYEGHGTMAWYGLHTWFTKLAGEGVTQKRKYVVSPPRPNTRQSWRGRLSSGLRQ